MSVPYKGKPGRVKDKVRKAPKMPSSSKSGTLGTDGHGGSATGATPNDDTVPYKKKPPRKGRPDGA